MRIVVSRSDPSLFAAQVVIHPDHSDAVAQVQALGPLDRSTTEVRHKGAPGKYSLDIQHAIERAFSRRPSGGNGAGPCVEVEATQVRTEAPMSEAEWQRVVVDLAHEHGWRVAHFAAARTEDGWRTPARADGKGFPDLVLSRHGSVMFRELKAENGKLSDEQLEWGLSLGNHWDVWRPSMLAEIRKVLA